MTFLSIDFLKNRYLRIAGAVLALALIFFAMVWMLAFYASFDAYRNGEIYFAQGKWIKAITYFDRSMHWYAPLNPYVEKSAQRLWELGERAERHGDLTLALIAYRTVRRGFYSASHFTTPGLDWIERCEARIRSIAPLEAKRRGWHYDQKQEREISERRGAPAPDVLWTMVLEVGLFGWIGCIIGFICLSLIHI